MKKAIKKILSVALVVMMLLGTFAMMFAYADGTEPVTTPKDYATAKDGEKLWDVDFSSEYFTPFDDSTTPLYNNGQVYLADGTLQDPSKTGNAPGAPESMTSTTLWNYKYGWYYNMWCKNIADTATVVEQDGAALKIDGKVLAVGYEGEEGYVPEISSDAKGTDQRYVGQINAYDLENKTYTYEIEYFRKGIVRSKIYFANGTFYNFGGSDPYMPCLGMEINNNGYRLMRQSSAVTTGVVGKPNYTVNEAGETTTNMKIVLSGGTKLEDVAIYNGTWTTPKAESAYWIGDVIPVEFSIYNTITKEDGTVQDIRVCTATLYQPADVDLVLGIGEYNNLGNSQYYGIRNVDIYKGNTAKPFDFGFAKVYEEAGWGSELTYFDARGITNAAYNYNNGYEWVNQGSTEVDAEGVIYINRSDRGATQGAYTFHPFGKEWNQGYYEMELTVNNASRLKIGLLDTADLSRVGFNILPNVSNEDLTVGSKTAYLHTDAANAAKLWTSGANSFGKGIVEESTIALEGYIKTIVYDTYDATDANEDGQPDDPRNVRDYGGNRANIKITYDCENYIITLYEKVDGEWLATSAIDYSGAVAADKIMGACLDFQAYNVNTNATIKNVRVLKGMSASKLHTYQVGTFTSEVYSAFDEDGAAYVEEYLDSVSKAYTERYGLLGTDWVWSANGKEVSGVRDAYDSLDPNNYGIQNIVFEPMVLECLGACVDNDSNHICDKCKKDMNLCADNDKDHLCDVCKKGMSECADNNSDHLCDLCGATLSGCVDYNNDHVCEICKEIASECRDRNRDHFCDICGERLSEHMFRGENHNCYYCGEEATLCVDNDLDHLCDVCDRSLTDCIDRDRDHKCDICFANVGVHAFREGSAVCEYCGETDQSAVQFKVEDGSLYVSYDFGESWADLGYITGNNGAEGEDGVTPIFKLNDGKLYVSYDGETTWVELGAVSSATVEAGEGGTKMLRFENGVLYPLSSNGATGIADSDSNSVSGWAVTAIAIGALALMSNIAMAAWMIFNRKKINN